MSTFLHSLLIFFGLLLIFRAFKTFRAGKESLTWKPATAYVITADIGKIERYGLIGSLIFQTYLPIIRYNYTVDGIEYCSENYSPIGDKKFESYFGFPGPNRAKNFIMDFPDNTKITIYYSSDHHDKAVIKTGVGLISFLPQMLVGIVLLFSFLIF